MEIKHVETIIDYKEFINDNFYIYSTEYGKNIRVLKKISGDSYFQNESHKQDYLDQRPRFCPFLDLETNKLFDLSAVDYQDDRYRIYPLTKENLGFIFIEMKKFKKNINLVLKYFLQNYS